MTDLKPCPFCGKQVKISQSYLSFRYFIDCEDCCSTKVHDTQKEMTEFWNTRPAEEALKAEVERLKSKLTLVEEFLIVHRDHSILSSREDGKAYRAMNEFMAYFCNGLIKLINTDTEKEGEDEP